MTLRTYQNHSPRLARGAFVDSTAVVIGDVEIGEDSSVWPLTVIRGDMHRIRIGARTSVQDGCVLHITHASDYNPGGWPLLIGDDVTIGHGVGTALTVSWDAVPGACRWVRRSRAPWPSRGRLRPSASGTGA